MDKTEVLGKCVYSLLIREEKFRCAGMEITEHFYELQLNDNWKPFLNAIVAIST